MFCFRCKQIIDVETPGCPACGFDTSESERKQRDQEQLTGSHLEIQYVIDTLGALESEPRRWWFFSWLGLPPIAVTSMGIALAILWLAGAVDPVGDNVWWVSLFLNSLFAFSTLIFMAPFAFAWIRNVYVTMKIAELRRKKMILERELGFVRETTHVVPYR